MIPSFASPTVAHDIVDEIAELLASTNGPISPHGVRNLASRAPKVRKLADSAVVRELASRILGGHAQLVRSILFDKVPGGNWNVAWHQDLTIAVQERRDVKGFGPWSIKEGVVSVQPPVEVLESMITLRLHLDPCGPENGPVRVIHSSNLNAVSGVTASLPFTISFILGYDIRSPAPPPPAA